MYSSSGYGKMIADSIRTQAYEEALRQTVQPGSVVLDIGTGIGIFALFVCRFGAGKVYAAEPSPVIGVAQQIADVNGYGERIEFIQALTTEVDLPQADVIVSDICGILPLLGRNVAMIVDARQRLLASNGWRNSQSDRSGADGTVSRTLFDLPTSVKPRW